MSDQRRATLTPFGKSDKKTKGSLHKTYRLRFTLSDPSEDSCPVFDYASVVKTEEKKFVKKKHEAKSNGIIDSLDSDEDVKRIARKFEEKYGDKKSKCKSYAELGAGYDETDPFIDNTEACDEAIQEDQETFCGGYYINSGPLELKRVEVSDQSDADEVGKRRIKKLPVIQEENDIEERESEEDETKESDDEEEVKTETHVLPEVKKIKKCEEPKVIEEKPVLISNEGLPKKKKKRLISEEKNSVEDSIKSKRAKTVKDILEEKRASEPPKEPEKKIASITSISEAIESVVNARNNDENSNSSNSSQSVVASSSTSEDSQEGKPSSQVTPTPLPDNLSPELLSLIEHIKNTAAVTDNTRKTLCTDINNCLVKIEWKCREFSTTNRNLLFSHLACYLPCTKDTLMRRAKKLFIHKEESQIDTIICKLKATIDATMPSLLEKHAKECQRIEEERGITTSPNLETNHNEENNMPPDTVSPKLPKRKFPWTDETRGYLREIVRLKNRCYKVLKPRKSTGEEYVSAFLHSKVRLLWPPGWMKTSVLHKECNRSPHGGKFKHVSSNHRSFKNESSGLNMSDSYSSPNTSGGTPLSLYVSANMDSSYQPAISPLAGSTPVVAAKTAGEPINLLNKITTSLNSSSSNPKKPGKNNHSKAEKTETFSMDCLLKRTKENADCNDKFVSDLSKKESVIINGASLPFKNVNSSQATENSRSGNILDLSSCNSVLSGTPSVIQITNERTAICTSDSVSLNMNSNNTSKPAVTPLPSKNEVSSHISNRKQRLLQVNTQPNWHTHSSCDSKKTDNDYKWPHSAHKSMVPDGKKLKPVTDERRLSEETTTATDILSQIISDSLRTPSQHPIPTSPYNTKAFDDGQVLTSPMKGQELLFDVMQDLKELNNLSSGGLLDSKQENKSNSYSGSSWSHGKKHDVSANNSSQFQSQFLKHIMNSQETAHSPISSPPYNRHSVSPYENSHTNDINKPIYNTPHRSAQVIPSHSGSLSKDSHVNQGCIMKPLQNMGIASGHAHRFMPQVEYSTDDQHLLGLASGLQYGLSGWPYTGNESQSHK